MKSLGFSKFRLLMDIWDEYLLEQNNENNIKSIIEEKELIMFFRKDNEYYGAGEEGRIIYAKLKNPNEKMPEGWEKEANFTAFNLTKLVEGQTIQNVFGYKDLKKIKIISEEKLIEKLKNKVFKNNLDNAKKEYSGSKEDRDKAKNFIRTDEE